MAVNIKQIKGTDNLLAQAAFVQQNLNGKIAYENGNLVLSVPLKTLQEDVSTIDFSQMDDSTLVIKKYVDDNISALKGTASAQADTLGELENAIKNLQAGGVSATADYSTGTRIGSITINDDTVDFKIDLSSFAPLASPSFIGAPTAPTPATTSNDTQIATTAFVANVKAALVDSAATTLNTIGKLAAAINNDASYYQTVSIALGTKVSKSDITITGSTGSGTEIGSIIYDNTTYRFKVDLSTFAPLNSPGFTGVPTAPTADQGTDTTQIATTAFVNSAVSAVKGAPPTNLNTLQKLASAIGGDAAYSTTVSTALSNKQPLNTALTSIAGLTTAANKMIYTTGANTYAVTGLTEAARDLLDDADVATMRGTLNVPSKTGVGASGSWNISVTSAGTATTATNAVNDGNGDEISTTYLKIEDHVDPDLSGYALSSSIKTVTVSNTLSTGTRLATIKVGNTSTDINVNLSSYAPLASPIFTGSPTAPTVEDQDDDSTKVATTAFVAGAIRRLVGTSIEGLDTLQELATAINNDPGFAVTIANDLAGKQPLHATLTSISGLTTTAGKMLYTTGTNTYALATLSDFARTILDDGNAAAVRTTIGALGTSEKAASATTADTATTAGSATNATNATNDADGNLISTTYVKTSNIHKLTEVNNIGWASSTANSAKVVGYDTLARWNGLYNSTSSNLAYCNQGAFGTIVTHAEGDYLTKTQADSYYMAAGTSPDLTGYLTADDLDTVSVTATNTTGDTIGTITVGSNSIPLKVLDISGNAGTATILATSRNIEIKDADSTNTGTGASFNGSSDITLKLPATIKATLSGNASTATTLLNARDLNVSDSTGTHTGTAVSFDGSANKTIKLPATLDAAITGNAATATALATAQTIKIANSDGTNPTTGTSFSGNAGITLNLPSTITASLNGLASSATALATAQNINVSDSTGTHTGTAISFDGSAGGTIKLPSTLDANITGNAATATTANTAATATSATNATNATNDSNGASIVDNYAKKASVISAISVTGSTLTYTKGDSTTDTADLSSVNTHYVSSLISGESTSTSNAAVSTNGNVYLRLFDDSTNRGSIKIYGGGGVSVTSPTAGQVYINADANTDTKVIQTSTTTSGNYPIIASASTTPTTGAAAQTIYNTGITMNPATGTVTATTFSGNATTATALETIRTVDGVQFDGDNNICHYGVCSTAAATVKKEVTISNIKGFTLATGARATVKFSVTNTATAPTLSINGTTAAPIYYRGYAIPAEALQANSTYDLVYNGTQWEIVGSVIWTS